jgi:hypothetical protein
MRLALANVVKDNTELKKTVDIVQQWHKLVVEPLKSIHGSHAGPVVIVMDALDESGEPATREHLLRVLSSKLVDPGVPHATELPSNVRIVVTSRPLDDISDKFKEVDHIKRVSMDNIPLDSAEDDIQIYVEHKLKEIASLGEVEFTTLAKKAEGLFEWARIACEYIKDTRGSTPMEQYRAIMSHNPGKLNSLYHFILSQIVPDDDVMGVKGEETPRSKFLSRFRSVMSQVLGTAEPLPLASLKAMRSQFPDTNDRYDVGLVVNHMGSLLSGVTDSSSPIRPLHASFRDFLAEKNISKEFFVEVSNVQHDLAFASLQVMADSERGLRFNICELESSYYPNAQIPGLQETIKRCISPHLSYSCRFWLKHILEASHNTTVDKKEIIALEKSLVKVVSFFNDERILFWLEALSLTDALTSSTASELLRMTVWLKVSDYLVMMEAVEDAKGPW